MTEKSIIKFIDSVLKKDKYSELTEYLRDIKEEIKASEIDNYSTLANIYLSLKAKILARLISNSESKNFLRIYEIFFDQENSVELRINELLKIKHYIDQIYDSLKLETKILSLFLFSVSNIEEKIDGIRREIERLKKKNEFIPFKINFSTIYFKYNNLQQLKNLLKNEKLFELIIDILDVLSLIRLYYDLEKIGNEEKKEKIKKKLLKELKNYLKNENEYFPIESINFYFENFNAKDLNFMLKKLKNETFLSDSFYIDSPKSLILIDFSSVEIKDLYNIFLENPHLQISADIAKKIIRKHSLSECLKLKNTGRSYFYFHFFDSRFLKDDPSAIIEAILSNKLNKKQLKTLTEHINEDKTLKLELCKKLLDPEKYLDFIYLNDIFVYLLTEHLKDNKELKIIEIIRDRRLDINLSLKDIFELKKNYPLDLLIDTFIIKEFLKSKITKPILNYIKELNTKEKSIFISALIEQSSLYIEEKLKILSYTEEKIKINNLDFFLQELSSLWTKYKKNVFFNFYHDQILYLKLKSVLDKVEIKKNQFNNELVLLYAIKENKFDQKLIESKLFRHLIDNFVNFNDKEFQEKMAYLFSEYIKRKDIRKELFKKIPAEIRAKMLKNNVLKSKKTKKIY